MSQTFVEILAKFNRKERYYLLGMALGNPTFAISQEFTNILQRAFPDRGIDFSEARFVAMDYHIDWIYASLCLCTKAPPIAILENGIHLYPRDNRLQCITATQQDIDLVIAFGDLSGPALTHFIMLEAKGATGWTNFQLQEKAKRLEVIFGSDGKEWKDIVAPYFAILSPKKPSDRLSTSGFPEFMKPNGQLTWLEMSMPSGLQKVTLCDENGRDCQDGPLWKVETH